MTHILLNIYSLFLYALLYTHSAITVILCIIASYVAPRSVFTFITRLWAHGILLILGARLVVNGREHIPTSNKYLILTNHASLFDIPILMAVFPNVTWLGRDYLTKIPILGHMLKRANYIPVRKNPAINVRLVIQKSIMTAQKISIALFPEGTRTVDGQLQEFKRGFIHIMNGGDLDIVPVVMNGLYTIKPKTRFSIKPFQKVEIFITEPIKRTALINLSNDEIINQVRDVFIANYAFEKEKSA